MSLHSCTEDDYNRQFESGRYGEAVRYCEEQADGKLWVSNGEYDSQVNYCPFCGYAAAVQVERFVTGQSSLNQGADASAPSDGKV